MQRLKRLKGRAVFCCQEQSVDATRAYVESTGLEASFTFQRINFRNHNDAWTLRDIPERRAVRQWLAGVLRDRTGTYAVSGRVVDAKGRGLAAARVESGAHWTLSGRGGNYVLRGLIVGLRQIRASKGSAAGSATIDMKGRNQIVPDVVL
jgi:hypothetical protein